MADLGGVGSPRLRHQPSLDATMAIVGVVSNNKRGVVGDNTNNGEGKSPKVKSTKKT